MLFYILTMTFCVGLFAQERPRILIIGDNVLNEPSQAAKNVLKDRAEVVFGKNGSWDSSTALANFDILLDKKKWDLIYFNFGLNDVMHKDPNTKKIRAMHKDVGGVKVSSPQLYEKNLDELVRKLKASGAKVLWGATTPIIGSNGIHYAGDEIEYNKIAARVMKSASVPIVDMHSRGVASHKTMRKGHGRTYSYKGGIPLHPPIVNAIIKELKLGRPVKGPVKVFIMAGGPAITGQGMIYNNRTPKAGRPGTLDELVLNPKTKDKYKHLLNPKGGWGKRNDVWVNWAGRASGVLTIGLGERSNMIGPELGFGHVMGREYEQQVMILKPYLNNPSLGSFFTKSDQYKALMTQMGSSLANINSSFPDYTEKTGYEISGIVLSFGRNEKDPKSFAVNLAKLVSQMRSDLKKPNLPVIILGIGLLGSKYSDIIKAQQSTASKLAGVSFADIRPFRPDQTKSPDKSPERFYGNAESFYKIGEAIAQEMLKISK